MIAPCAEFWKGAALLAAVTSLFALPAVASQLSAPGNLRVADFSATTLSLSADEVPGATGYAFEVVRLEGVPETEIRENFALAPSLSASRWALSSSNAKLEYYSSQSYYDIHTSDKRALRIDRESSVGDVTVEIETPVCEAAIRSCSFVCRVGSRKSDVFRVMGRTDSSSAWAELHEFWPDNAKTNITVSVDVAANVRQAKFVFAASASDKDFSVAAWDSLSVVYGGDETRTEVQSGATVLAAPQFATNSLPTALYAFRVRALGGGGQQDSPWSDEQMVDLSWADLTVDPPTGVVVADVGGRLRISWNAVENAASYLVTVVPSGNPSMPVVEGLSTTVTSCDVEVPSLGEYSAVVTAVSPGGKSSASSDAVSGQVTQGHFRLTGAAPLRGTAFRESFSSLTNMTGDTAVKNAYLDYWQFLKDSAEPEKLLLTSTTNRPTGGVHAFCDTTVDSFALGSLATGDYGCAFGIALVNDGNTDVNGNMMLSFDSIQRSFRKNPATYVLEWKVTTGETGIDSEGGWTAVSIPPTAPYVAGSANCPYAEYRQRVSVRIAPGRRLAHGDVLILRWTHPKISSGPMMAIDNVRLDFLQPLRMIFR